MWSAQAVRDSKIDSFNAICPPCVEPEARNSAVGWHWITHDYNQLPVALPNFEIRLRRRCLEKIQPGSLLKKPLTSRCQCDDASFCCKINCFAAVVVVGFCDTF